LSPHYSHADSLLCYLDLVFLASIAGCVFSDADATSSLTSSPPSDPLASGARTCVQRRIGAVEGAARAICESSGQGSQREWAQEISRRIEGKEKATTGADWTCYWVVSNGAAGIVVTSIASVLIRMVASLVQLQSLSLKIFVIYK
jgi:hypothetical protein